MRADLPGFSHNVGHLSLWDKRILLLGLLLALATIAVYLPVAHHPFLNLDDNQYVTANPHMQNGLSWDTVQWAFTSYWSFNWHPLTWLSTRSMCRSSASIPSGRIW